MRAGSSDRPPVDGEAIDQLVDDLPYCVLRRGGQMGVANGRQNRAVAEDVADLGQIGARLDQMGGIAVAQTMGRNLFLSPQSATTRRKVVCTPPRSKGVVARAAPCRPP